MLLACAQCRKPAPVLPPLRWWVTGELMACCQTCAAAVNEWRAATGHQVIRWSYVDAPGEPRDSSVTELSILLTLAHLRATASRRGPAAPDSAFNQPTTAGAELRFVTGAAVVILSRRDSLMPS
jgi:hypothetical protein